jgi:excinuclease ABC subunit C
MTYEKYKKIDFPKKPGVYFFKKDEEVLYIGKATNLAHRTNSYLQKNLMDTRGPFIVKMVEETDTIIWTETESALEALILESYLIKKYQPTYNTREKDNRSYNYVVITNELAPRIFTVRQRTLRIIEGKQDNSLLHVFGPFPDRDQLTTALKIIRKIFPFHSKKTIHKNNIEFYKQLGLVPDSLDSEARRVYMKNITYIALFFQGKKKSLISELKKEMMHNAKVLKFERASVIKRQIYSLEHIHDMALLKHNFEGAQYLKNFRMEAYDIAHIQGQAMVGVMVVHTGVEIDTSEHRVFNIQSVDRANDTAALYEVIIRRLNHAQWPYPQIIVVDGGIAQKRVIEKALRERNLTIPVMAVVKDEKHKAREILGLKKISEKYHKHIVALNAESHRFALKQHTLRRDKNFLNEHL